MYSFSKKLLKINDLYLSVYPYTKLQYCIFFYGDCQVKELGPY